MNAPHQMAPAISSSTATTPKGPSSMSHALPAPLQVVALPATPAHHTAQVVPQLPASVDRPRTAQAELQLPSSALMHVHPASQLPAPVHCPMTAQADLQTPAPEHPQERELSASAPALDLEHLRPPPQVEPQLPTPVEPSMSPAIRTSSGRTKGVQPTRFDQFTFLARGGQAMEEQNLDHEAYFMAFGEMKPSSVATFSPILGDADDMVVEAHEICFHSIMNGHANAVVFACADEISIPSSFNEAMASNDKQQWIAAMQAEIKSLSSNGVFSKPPLPADH
jgi:hypothetical protein